LLDNDAIQVLVEYTIEMVSELSIRQEKNYIYVDNIEIDYNDSSKMMRIKCDPSAVSEQVESNQMKACFQQIMLLNFGVFWRCILINLASSLFIIKE
jgi:hypothetical protein